jgi:hypothetical protein
MHPLTADHVVAEAKAILDAADSAFSSRKRKLETRVPG